MSELNRDDRIRELFLKVFVEEGVSEEELKEAILQTYIDADFKCTTFEEIPIIKDILFGLPLEYQI